MTTAIDRQIPPTNLGNHLAKRAEANPRLEALVDVAAGVRLTYAELDRRVNQVTRVLHDCGLHKGDRVAVLLPNCHQFVEVFYAVARAGLVAVPMNLRLTARELAHILSDSGSKALVWSSELDAVVDELHATAAEDGVAVEHWMRVGGGHDWAEDWDAAVAAKDDGTVSPVGGDFDPLFIMYTSGTTGRPKGVLHTHDSVEWSILTALATADFRFRDRYLICLPLFHVGALNPVVDVLYRGGTVVLLRTFDARRMWEVFRDEKVTVNLSVPAMLQMMLDVYDPAVHQPLHLRWIMSGASPVPVTLMQAYADLGFEIHQVYGSTETAGPACLISPDEALTHLGSTGKAFFHTEVRLVDQAGNEVGVDEPGEILVRGRHIMAGYWNNPTATAETIVDGWLHTGDIAVQDAEGFIYIRDRIKDMIISGGENIYPAEIEDVLLSHPKVADVAVIGIPSERWGESPLAVVVTRDESLTEDDILGYSQGKLARFKQPAKVTFIEAIPRNPSGKALKTELREMFASLRT